MFVAVVLILLAGEPVSKGIAGPFPALEQCTEVIVKVQADMKKEHAELVVLGKCVKF